MTALFLGNAGRHTATAKYCNTRVLSQLGMAPRVEVNWIFVIKMVSSRLATIRARLTEKKTPAGDNGGHQEATEQQRPQQRLLPEDGCLGAAQQLSQVLLP